MTKSRSDIDDFPELLRLEGHRWAELDGQAMLLEHQRKVIHAELFNRMEGTVAEREAQAHAHVKYADHLERMVAARTEANKARADLEAKRVRWETWRSRNANKRAEMKL